MKALVGAFNHDKAIVGAFSVIVKTDGSFAALRTILDPDPAAAAEHLVNTERNVSFYTRYIPHHIISRLSPHWAVELCRAAAPKLDWTLESFCWEATIAALKKWDHGSCVTRPPAIVGHWEPAQRNVWDWDQQHPPLWFIFCPFLWHFYVGKPPNKIPKHNVMLLFCCVKVNTMILRWSTT